MRLASLFGLLLATSLFVFTPNRASAGLEEDLTLALTHAYDIESFDDRFVNRVTTTMTGSISYIGDEVDTNFTSPPSGYNFDSNPAPPGPTTAGVTLTNVIDAEVYSLEIWFSLADTSDFTNQDIVDFNNGTDKGVFAFGKKVRLQHGPGDQTTTSGGDADASLGQVFDTDVVSQLVVTRNASRDVRVYVDGAQITDLNYSDPISENDFVFGETSGETVANILPGVDSDVFSAGFIQRVRVYNEDISVDEVALLWGTDGTDGFDPVAVPEPSAIVALSVLALVIGGVQWRRRRRSVAKSA